MGKTTISVNLSALAASEIGEVVLIDGDMGNPSVGIHLGLWGYTNGLQNVLSEKCDLDNAVVMHPSTGIRVVPSTLEYTRGVKTARLKEVMDKSAYKMFILDSPPGVSQNVEDILRCCTETVVVVTPDVPSVMSAVKIIELAKNCNVKVNGLVLNRVMNKKYEMHHKEIESTCNAPILVTIPEDRIVPESISARMPAVIYKPRSPVSKNFNDLAVELGIGGKMVGGEDAEGNAFARFFRWISKLFGGR